MSTSDISSANNMCKMWEAPLMFNWLISKVTHKSYFDIYHAVTIFNCRKKVAENQYTCRRSENISSLSDISSHLLFLKSLRTTAEVNLANFQDPIQRVILTLILLENSLYIYIPKKLPDNHYVYEKS